MASSFYSFSALDIHGNAVRFDSYLGRPVLVVNVASKCGFTPQYAGLEQLWKTYGPRGLLVLGFPCNQFGGQEPEGEEKIAEFCSTTYGVTFPMFSRIEVNGEDAHPLYVFLKSSLPGVMGSEAIKWNFTKFLVDRFGKPVARFAPTTKPEELVQEIEALL